MIIWPGWPSTLNHLYIMVVVVAIAASGKPNLPKQPNRTTYFSVQINTYIVAGMLSVVMYSMEILKNGFIILIGVVIIMIVVFHTQHVPYCRNCFAGTVENWDRMGSLMYST